MIVAAFPKYDSYKPTGIEWVPEAPEHWEVVPITAAARVVSEANQPALELLSVYLGRGVIRFSDVDEKRTNATSTDLSKYQVVRPGNLVLNNQQAWRGSVGVSSYTGIVSPAYIVLDFTYGFDPRFADYYFQTPTTVAHFLISSKGVGTIQRNLYWPALRRCPITIPPLSEQRAIAAFLDDKCSKIDEAVRIKEEQIKLLRERRQILIQQAVTRGLNPDAPMKDSGIDWIGQIPAHWEVRSLRYAFRFRNNQRIPLSGSEREHMRGEYPYYGASGIIDYVVDYIFDEDLILIAEDGANLLSKSTPLAFVARGKYWVNNHAHILEPLFPGFEYWAETLSAVDYTTYISGSAQPKLTRDRLGSVRVPVPPLDEREKIIEVIKQQSAKFRNAIAIKENQITALKEYKTTLINAAVTGKIKVTEDGR